MDKVVFYKQVAKSIIEEVAAYFPENLPWEVQIVIDQERGQYILLDVGWDKCTYLYGNIVHIFIKPDGKVWLQHDGTDLNIALKMVEKGIPKKDIVLGFKEPMMRQMMEGWAVA
ncbi:MAG: XisI protein [Saprospiraceae bacterium]|nr:XisI protein [Saprospiraceae bacterium]